jgi:hypothetical protein
LATNFRQPPDLFGQFPDDVLLAGKDGPSR